MEGSVQDSTSHEEWPRAGESVIWKFKLRPWTIFIDLPKDAQVLSVGAQGDDVVAWVRCDPWTDYEARLLAAHPTGVPIPPALLDAQFVGTVQMDDGLVFHVFYGDGPKGRV
jgi:hypothetical protein